MKLKILLFTCFLILILSCEQESALEKYYYQEGNFSGSIYDALDTTGLYKIFIEAIDSTYMANQLKNTLVTVVAPSDKAFEAYFAKHGYNDLSSVPITVLQDLIGYHVITWPHSPGSFKDDPISFRRKSNMPNGTVVKFDPLEGNKTILKETKYLQFYYPEMLSFNGGTENDYNLLTGCDLSPKTEFNIQDVPVDTIVAFGNGWVYYVDQVVEPIENMDDWLMYSSDYSLFSFLYSRFNKYTTDTPSKKRSDLYQFLHNYRVDFDLAYEPVWYNAIGGTGSEYQLKSRSAFNVLAPKDEALESFIDEYFKDYPGFKDSIKTINRSSIDNCHIDKIAKAMILPYCLLDQTVFPSKLFSDEGVLGADKTVLKFNEQDISEYKLCSNGYGYGLNRYEVPRTFKGVLKPVFTTPDYKYFAAVVVATKSNSFLNSLTANYTLFVPTDQAFIDAGIEMVDPITAINKYGATKDYNDNDADESLGTTYFYDLNGADPLQMSAQDMFGFVFNHIITENVTSSDQTQYVVNAVGDYIGITKDKIWSGGNVNNYLNVITTPGIVKSFPESSFDNGSVYIIDALIKSPELAIGDIIKRNPAFSQFLDLCKKAGLFASNGELQINGTYPTVFIPTNEALEKFISEGNEPSDEKLLQDFIKYFFVNRTIFTNETVNMTYSTLCLDEQKSTEFKAVFKNAELNGTYGNLKIKGLNNSSFINVIEGATSNIICTDGIIHQIDGVLN